MRYYGASPALFLKMVMKEYLVLLLAAVCLSGTEPQSQYPYTISDFRPEIGKQINNICRKGQIPFSADSAAKVYLRDSCTKNELLHLLAFENPLVRVVAYRAIVERNEYNYFSILLGHLDDTVKVTWWCADDVICFERVSDIMIQDVKWRLSRGQKDTLIDRVLTRHIYLDIAWEMMKDIPPQEKYYGIVKAQSQLPPDNCHHLGLTYALAKFGKQEDLPFMHKQFAAFSDNPYCNNYIFKSIEVFPDSSFFDLLTGYFEAFVESKKQRGYDDLKYYCRAVAVYKNESSLAILTALTKPGTYPDAYYIRQNKENVFIALHKHRSPLYESLYNELKPQMSEYILKYLNDPDYFDQPTW